ncbi:pyridoxal phosphate-dependent transferase [Aspergillus pseudotamarii]|uniref:Pyridoxal phosphate-dependent transferase n=1 Tax=Aspergillus pseudotamarii TaxID=132259 RepID=A0A5N6S983_ASPPS|nr:pyridoxal phosphate-dependent transferase [Aspergillus pseudotamarii]KAE8131115.1 pyridoxal phosphate-dependent transferase [Aspergillus pseudotamarii]
MDKHTNTIPTTCTTIIGTELANIEAVLTRKSLSDKGTYTRLCEQWLEQFLEGNSGRALDVSSYASALEMAAILADIQPGDEVVVPSYTYVTTVNAFALRGPVPVFVDLEDATMNIDASNHSQVAKRHELFICGDTAMACMSTYKGQMLGTIGNVGCLSFQEKKNNTAGGQGGALLINDPALVERAEILYDHGTNRSHFMRSEVDRYQWLDLGLNATLSELQAAFLYAHLQAADCINARRRHIWGHYFVSLLPLVRKGYITLPHAPDNTTHNANMFYIRLMGPTQRQDMIRHMASAKVQEVVIREVFAFWDETAEGGI